ncbi:MAG TPA: hypothetical protein VIK02_05965 [Candidatus Anoxymicrobiaceae bacterium]
MRKSRAFIIVSLVAIAVTLAFVLPGCGKKDTSASDPTEGRPESVTAYEAVQYTKPAASKWQANNWMIQVRSGDPDGIGKDGKAKIWEVYYFSPVPEEDSQMFVIYNRGNVWPNAPGSAKGGDKGLETYRKGKPVAFRVDSPEALEVANRNGGGDFLDGNPDAHPNAVLRCKADYDAIGETMPSPKYKWIWDVYYRVSKAGSDVLHIYVDGMNGDFITKNLQKTPSQSQ